MSNLNDVFTSPRFVLSSRALLAWAVQASSQDEDEAAHAQYLSRAQEREEEVRALEQAVSDLALGRVGASGPDVEAAPVLAVQPEALVDAVPELEPVPDAENVASLRQRKPRR